MSENFLSNKCLIRLLIINYWDESDVGAIFYGRGRYANGAIKLIVKLEVIHLLVYFLVDPNLSSRVTTLKATDYHKSRADLGERCMDESYNSGRTDYLHSHQFPSRW
jgi:hypothetical protein